MEPVSEHKSVDVARGGASGSEGVGGTHHHYHQIIENKEHKIYFL